MKDKEVFNWKRIGSYTAADYKFYLNQIATAAKHKDEMTIDDKLAIALLFELEYHARYKSDLLFMQSLAVLDTYAVFKKDEKDIFGRTILDISKIPASTKRFFIKLYKEEIKGLDSTYKKLENLAKSGPVTLPVFNGTDLSEYEGEEDEDDGILVEGHEDDYYDDDEYEDE